MAANRMKREVNCHRFSKMLHNKIILDRHRVNSQQWLMLEEAVVKVLGGQLGITENYRINFTLIY